MNNKKKHSLFMNFQRVKFSFQQFWKERGDLLFFMGFSLVPILNLLRIIMRSILPAEILTPALFFLSLFWLVFFLLVMANFQKAKCYLVSFFFRLFNTKIVQNLLLFFLMLEQFFYFHTAAYFVMLFIIGSGLAVLLCSESLFLSLLAQIFVVLAALHLRLRDRIFNTASLASAGLLLKGQALTWDMAISGLGTLLAKKMEPFFSSQKSILFFNGTTLATRNCMYFLSIQNQLPHRNKVTFPFSFVAPGSQRNVSTRAGIKNMWNWLASSMQQHPNGVLGTAGVGVGFGYAVVHDQQRIAFEKRKHAEEMEMRKIELQEKASTRIRIAQEETKLALAQEETKIRLAEEKTKEKFFELESIKQKIALVQIEQEKIDRQEKVQRSSTTFSARENNPEVSSRGSATDNSSFPISSSENKPPMIPSALEETSSIFLNAWRLFRNFLE